MKGFSYSKDLQGWILAIKVVRISLIGMSFRLKDEWFFGEKLKI